MKYNMTTWISYTDYFWDVRFSVVFTVQKWTSVR
jgi:hypothetical protein